MPFIISREEAIEQINLTLNENDCLVCSILKTDANYVLYKGNHVTIVLSKYPKTWGQTMVLLNAHKTSITEISTPEWEELMQGVRKTALTIQAALKPKRCYIASLGATKNLPNTCPHIHFNLLPVYNEEDKPTTIFSWKDGLCNGTDLEWENLFKELKLTFDAIKN